MTRRLLLGYLAVTAVVLLMLEIPLGVTFARRERDALVADVRRDAESIARYATAPLANGNPDVLQDVATAYGAQTGGRLVVVDADGTSVADGADEPGRGFASRPEVAAALNGEETTGFRRSDSLGQTLLYVAVPVDPAGTVVGAVRVTHPADIVDDRIRRTWLLLGAVAVLALGVVAALGWWLSRSIAGPVRAVEDAARRLGEGDLDARAPLPEGPPELRRLAEEVNDAAVRIEQLLRTQDALLADVSHQLRTPLTAVRLRLEMLEGRVEAASSADLDGALTELDRLSRLVDGLLHAARAESEQGAPVALDLVPVVEDRRDAWAPVAAEKGVELITRAPDRAVAHTTPGGVEQVLDNLLANALEVSPDGARVWLTIAIDGDWVEVHVADEGPGMDHDRRGRAFDRFSSISSGGFGLGLAIAQRLLTRDGGRLDLLEAPTGGLDARARLRAAAG